MLGESFEHFCDVPFVSVLSVFRRKQSSRRTHTSSSINCSPPEPQPCYLHYNYFIKYVLYFIRSAQKMNCIFSPNYLYLALFFILFFTHNRISHLFITSNVGC